MDAKVIAVLAKQGVEVCRSLDISPRRKYNPICRVWHESEDLTDEEIALLGRFVKHQLEHLFAPSERDARSGAGANTCTVWKRARWYRLNKYSWEGNPWVSYRTLKECLKQGYNYTE